MPRAPWSSLKGVHLINWNGIVEDDKEEGSAPAEKAKKKDSLLVRLETGEQ